jgi:hypothetical protein
MLGRWDFMDFMDFMPLGLRRKERSERGEGRGFGARRQVRPRPATSVSFTRRSHPP